LLASSEAGGSFCLLFNPLVRKPKLLRLGPKFECAITANVPRGTFLRFDPRTRSDNETAEPMSNLLKSLSTSWAKALVSVANPNLVVHWIPSLQLC